MITQRRPPAGGDRSRIEVELQERVARAREQYEQAIAEARRLAAESRNGNPHLNDSSKITQALQLQNTATRRYSEALRALSEFVLGYKERDCA
jgi:hypothetical protein